MFSRAYIVCRSDHLTSFSILWSCLIFKVESRCLSYISRIHWHFTCTVHLSAWNLFTVVFRMFCLESALLREPVAGPIHKTFSCGCLPCLSVYRLFLFHCWKHVCNGPCGFLRTVRPPQLTGTAVPSLHCHSLIHIDKMIVIVYDQVCCFWGNSSLLRHNVLTAQYNNQNFKLWLIGILD